MIKNTSNKFSTKIDQLFLFVGSFFLLTIGIFFYLLNSEKNIAINFAEKELQGTQYLRLLRQSVESLNLHRMLTYAPSPRQKSTATDISDTVNSMDEALRALAAIDAPLAAAFETGNKVKELADQWSDTKGALIDLSPAEINQRHIQLFSKIRKLITLIGDHSNLILDPDLDSYYTMDTILLKLPEAQDLLFQTALLLQETTSKGSFSEIDRMRHIVLKGNLRLNQNGLRSGIQTAFNNNRLGNLRGALLKPLQMYDAALEALLKKSDEIFVIQEGLPPENETLLLLSEITSNASFELWDKSVEELDQLLMARISEFKQRKLYALITVILMTLLTSLFGILIFRIIANRKKTESALRISEERFRAISEASPLGIYVTNTEGDCVYVNNAYQLISGLTMEGAAGKGWSDGIHPEDRDRVINAWYEFTKNPVTFESEHRFLRKDGSVISTNVKSAPIRDGENIIGYVGTVEDTTGKKRLEEQLLQSQKMETVGSLAGGIAHDLNNHLSPLVGYLDLIVTELPSNNPNFPLLEEANLAAHRCAEVAKRLLNFSRSSTSKKSAFQIKKLLEELRGLLHSFIPSAIKVTILCDDLVDPILGNETELQTVLMNLATNARDAMPEGGTFTVKVNNVQLDESLVKAGQAAGSYVLISARDTGKGIPPEIIKKIFDPFFTTKTKGRGTGLGLAMAFSIIKDHHGWLEVLSEIGSGTEFRIYLPSHQGAISDDHESMKLVNSLPRGNETVLLVDDEEPLRRMGKTFLDRLGYRVLFASNGEEASKIYAEHSQEISAVIMDMTMPGLTGRQTLKKILSTNPKAIVLLASGYTAEGSVQELLKEGASAYIEKPYDIASLAKKLREALDRK